MPEPSETADDPAVVADDQLIEDLRAGAEPPTGDQVSAYLASLRADVRQDDLPIFDAVVARLLFVPERAPGIEDQQVMPAVVPAEQRQFVQPDGSTYGRISASEFESFDEVDSTTIVDPGAPA